MLLSWQLLPQQTQENKTKDKRQRERLAPSRLDIRVNQPADFEPEIVAIENCNIEILNFQSATYPNDKGAQHSNRNLMSA